MFVLKGGEGGMFIGWWGGGGMVFGGVGNVDEYWSSGVGIFECYNLLMVVCYWLFGLFVLVFGFFVWGGGVMGVCWLF